MKLSRLLMCAMFCAAVIGFAGLVCAESLSLYPQEDASIHKWSWETGNENYGTGTTLDVANVPGYGGQADSMMRWDLNTIPDGITITKVSLSWNYQHQLTDGDGNTGCQFIFSKVAPGSTGSDWTSASVTWNNAPARGTNFFMGVIPGGSTQGLYYTFSSDLTNGATADDGLAVWVKDALAEPAVMAAGWRIWCGSGNNTGASMYSSENWVTDMGNPYTTTGPYLTIEYTRANTAMLFPSADAVIYQQNPTSNDNSTDLAIASINWPLRLEALMRFDLSALPRDITITKAAFGAYCWWPCTDGDSPTGANVSIAPATGTWGESTVTWNTAPAAGTAFTSVFYPPGSIANQTGYHSVSDVSLANWVQSAIADPTIADRGWRMSVNGANNGVHLSSREAAENKPYLYLEYVRTNTHSVTVHPSADAIIGNAFGSTWANSGASVDLGVSTIASWPLSADTMMAWDLSAVPTGAVVTKATFGWHYYFPMTDGDGDTGKSCWFYQADSAWDEMTVTWDTAPAKGIYLFNNSVYPGYGTWRATTSDLTNGYTTDDDLGNWVVSALGDPTLATNGWRISGPNDSNSGATMRSRESMYQPYLTIEYMNPGNQIAYFNPAGDTSIMESTPDWNYATETELNVANDTYGLLQVDTMLNFDFSSIPSDAVVSKVAFGWYYWYPLNNGDWATGAKCVFSQPSDVWDPYSVTWNNAPARGATLFNQTVPGGWDAFGFQTVVSDATDGIPATGGLVNWVQRAISDPTLASKGWRVWDAGGNQSQPNAYTGIRMRSLDNTDPSQAPLLCVIYSQPSAKSVDEAKLQGNGSSVKLGGDGKTIVTAVFGDVFYVESTERASGIRVQLANHGVAVGDSVTVTGALDTLLSGERYVAGTSVVKTPSTALDPMAIVNKSVGGDSLGYNVNTGAGQIGISGGVGTNNIGLLIVTSGTVSSSGGGTFVVDDGSGTPVKCSFGGTLPADGNYVKVTGASSCERSGGLIKPVVLVTGWQKAN